MNLVESPKVYLVAKTMLCKSGLDEYLKDIGDPDWHIDGTVSDAENLIEAAGRMCYRSWQSYDPEKPEATNPNVTRVREGNRSYIGNVLRSGHGSILEHASMTVIMRNVSRVVTHELVRHRAGMAYSQESLRYVRLEDLNFWLPEAAAENEEVKGKYQKTVESLEQVQKDLAEFFDIANMNNFHEKKCLTSMFRRLAPIGLGTSIVVTGNLRAWRHVISMRSSESAEEEIRIVADQLAKICQQEFPNVFQDMRKNDLKEWAFENDKV
jgi:thymidylate synthase (FAD)